jgi:hypothetical protein
MTNYFSFCMKTLMLQEISEIPYLIEKWNEKNK